jgi:hypothetical protein
MKKLMFLLLVSAMLGCTGQQREIDFYVDFHTTGCAGFNESFSDSTITGSGLVIVSNIISPNPCYILDNAELAIKDNNLTIYFEMSKETGPCANCVGSQSIIYHIDGEGLNQSGINVEVITTFDDTENKHSFTT